MSTASAAPLSSTPANGARVTPATPIFMKRRRLDWEAGVGMVVSSGWWLAIGLAGTQPWLRVWHAVPLTLSQDSRRPTFTCIKFAIPGKRNSSGLTRTAGQPLQEVAEALAVRAPAPRRALA